MKKRLAAAILSFSMMLMLFPITAFAVENYDLYLYLGNESVGTRVTSENASDVLGDGTVSYDPDTCTLTLNNAKLAGIYTYGMDSKVLTIKVIGECIIDSPKFNAINLYATTSAGPDYDQDSLVITGDGTLKINALAGNNVGIATYNDVTIKDTNVEINSANHIAIALQTLNDPDLDDIDLNIINSTVTATTNGASTNAIWVEDGAIKTDNSTVTVKAESTTYPVLWAATAIEITNKSNVTATGCESNTFYSGGDIVINDSVVKATDTSEYASPAIYAYGDITVENNSTVTAESRGMRGIYTDGNMTIDGSTVTASGTTNEGMVVVGTLNVNNAKLTASGSPDDIYIPAIVAEGLHITASDVTAKGGIQLFNYSSGLDDNISFSITPGAGKTAEFKVDKNNWDGSAAAHFNEGTESPYDAAVNFDATEMNQLSSYRYVHIGEHIHAGGTATCTSKAVCSDCGREYGTALGHNVITSGARAATCTAEGYTGDKVCENCGEVFEKGKTIPMLAHNYKNGVCTVCGAPSDGNAPQTGERSDMVLWVLALTLSGCALAGAFVYAKRKKC